MYEFVKKSAKFVFWLILLLVGLVVLDRLVYWIFLA